MKKLTGTLAVALLLAALAGCGEEAVQADTTPFEAAIEAYLERRNMGMRVDEFETLEVKGASATARCVMKQKSGLHRIGVKWRFRFRRRDDGSWEVAEREVL